MVFGAHHLEHGLAVACISRELEVAEGLGLVLGDTKAL
jgi:hypothetical protein